MLRTRFAALGAALLLSAGPVSAQVVATFADPGTTSFSFADNGNNGDGIGNLTGGNADISVNLPVLGLTFSDASFTLTDSGGGTLATTAQITAGPLVQATFEGGILQIRTDSAANGYNAGDLLLQATFDQAIGTFGSVFAADALVGHNVVFSGPALGGLTASAESFFFSATNLSNPSALLAPPDMENWTATTSFTSSATLVPLPAALWLFGTGLVGMAGIARRKKNPGNRV